MIGWIIGYIITCILLVIMFVLFGVYEIFGWIASGVGIGLSVIITLMAIGVILKPKQQ